MTDEALAARAKAGDRIAMNLLLARHEPYIRRMVTRALRQAKRLFDVREDAMQVGRMAFWRCVQKWDPSRAPLTAFAVKAIQNAVWTEAANMGHGAWMPFGQRAPGVKCLDAPVGDDPDSPPLVASFQARNPDPSTRVDVERVLGRLSKREADLLSRVSDEESLADIGEDYGVSRETARHLIGRALRRAQAIAAHGDQRSEVAPIADAREKRDADAERVAALLAQRDMTATELHAAMGARYTIERVGRLMQHLRETGRAEHDGGRRPVWRLVRREAA